MSLDYHKLCGICAWRENCRKKFSLSQDALHCPDFSRDVTIKTIEEDMEGKEEKDK